MTTTADVKSKMPSNPVFKRSSFLIKNTQQSKNTPTKQPKKTQFKDQAKKVRNQREEALKNMKDAEDTSLMEEEEVTETTETTQQHEMDKDSTENTDKNMVDNPDTTKTDKISEKTDIDKLRDTIFQRENASVAAIEKLTEILVQNMNKVNHHNLDNNEQRQTTNKTTNENKDTTEKFNEYFSTDKTIQSKQNGITVEQILHPVSNLTNTTRDYTEELSKILVTNCKDPNIPMNDAINVKNKGMKEIETLNMLVNTIKNMKKQIIILNKSNLELKQDVINIKNQISQQPTVKNKNTVQPTQTYSQSVPIDDPNTKNTDEHNQHNDNEFQTQKTRNRRKKIEVTQVSPGPGEIDMTGNNPPIAYAKVLMNNIKPPKTKISEQLQQQLEQQGANFEKSNEYDIPQKYTKEQMNDIRNEISKSSHIVGLRPITSQHIHNEAQKILNRGTYNKRTQGNIIRQAATKNAVYRFLKDELLMDEMIRNSLTIQTIYPSKSDNNSIIYVQCEDQDDIAKITSRAPNLGNPSSHREEPGIVPNIPKLMYTRYQALEKLTWQIRLTNKGNIQTNIRLAKTDFLLRIKKQI